jgi:hypothetical protein
MKNIRIDTSHIDGKGVFADEAIKKGERIQYINGARMKKVTKSPHDSKSIDHWIGVGRFSWINTEGTPFRYINHSCEPNAAITGTKTVVAIDNIPKDGEITIDYSMTDADPHWGIHCRCGSKTCRREIRAIYTVPPEVFKRHMPYIPRYFQRAYIRNHVYERMGKRGRSGERATKA